MSIIADLLTFARKINHYEIYTGVADVFWIDTTHYRATVPTGKRWFLIGGWCYRDVSSTLFAAIYDASDNLLMKLADKTAATGGVHYPDPAVTVMKIIPMDATEYMEILFGVAQSTVAFATCIIMEVDV